MYEVAEHRYGSIIIQHGPMQGCRGFNEHKWIIIKTLRSLEKAKELANNSNTHCVVVNQYTTEKVYDNGKIPLGRE
jgi:hypothetical protein